MDYIRNFVNVVNSLSLCRLNCMKQARGQRRTMAGSTIVHKIISSVRKYSTWKVESLEIPKEKKIKNIKFEKIGCIIYKCVKVWIESLVALHEMKYRPNAPLIGIASLQHHDVKANQAKFWDTIFFLRLTSSRWYPFMGHTILMMYF